MYIKSLTLRNFRNYSSEHIDFSPGTNLIYGNNAQGKTNILEAIYLFSHGRSHRAKQDIELISFDAPYSMQEIKFFSQDRDFHSQMVINKNGKKMIKVNNIAITKLSKLMSYLNIVLFSPEDLSLVKGSPSVRRRFMDSAISQLYPNYLASLVSYQKALTQKNTLLKTLRKSGVKSDSGLSAWNMILASEGEKIKNYRNEFIKTLSDFSKSIQAEISGEELILEYEPNIKDDEDILTFLENHQRREIEYASSLFGIQRDDIKITVSGHDTRFFCSQGQQRTAALSLKIAQADFTEHIKDEYPILLLDDIMSELDKKRRSYLWNKIRDKQVLITCTDIDDFEISDTVKKLRVENGRVWEE